MPVAGDMAQPLLTAEYTRLNGGTGTRKNTAAPYPSSPRPSSRASHGFVIMAVIILPRSTFSRARLRINSAPASWTRSPDEGRRCTRAARKRSSSSRMENPWNSRSSLQIYKARESPSSSRDVGEYIYIPRQNVTGQACRWYIATDNPLVEWKTLRKHALRFIRGQLQRSVPRRSLGGGKKSFMREYNSVNVGLCSRCRHARRAVRELTGASGGDPRVHTRPSAKLARWLYRRLQHVPASSELLPHKPWTLSLSQIYGLGAVMRT